VNDSPEQILDALYKFLIIDQPEEIEKLGGKVLFSKVDGKTLKVVLGIKHVGDNAVIKPDGSGC
jgi:hypothetical protein